MGTTPTESRDENVDSRTANFERKRPHGRISSSSSSNNVPTDSAPRKRAKDAGNLGYQDVRDFVPPAGEFSKNPVAMEEIRDSGRDGSSSGLEDQNIKPAPSTVINVDGVFLDERVDGSINDGRCLYIENLPKQATEEDIRSLFADYSMLVPDILQIPQLLLTFN